MRHFRQKTPHQKFARCVAQAGVPDGRVTLCVSSSAGFWITLDRLRFTLVIVIQVAVISHIFQVFFYQGDQLPEQHLRPSVQQLGQFYT